MWGKCTGPHAVSGQEERFPVIIQVPTAEPRKRGAK